MHGTVLVDDAPASGLRVECHPVTPDPKFPVIPSAMTAADGKFAISTYESGDGAPAGEYRLSFVWGEYNLMNGQYSGDKLKGKYEKPESSGIQVSVSSKPVDLGEIKLTTK